MTTLLLIRHGANDWVHGRLAGRIPGVHLNDEGKAQAASLSERIADLPINTIYSSPIERCVETARAVAGPRNLEIRLVEEIGEVIYGEWEGAELKELYKHELWPGVQHYPSGTRFPKGESMGAAQMRMVTALDAIRERHPKEIVAVFSHADLIRMAIAYYVGTHLDLFQRFIINPCSVTAFSFERMGPRMLAYNEIGGLGHLKPRPPAPPTEEAPAEGAVAATPDSSQPPAPPTEEAPVEGAAAATPDRDQELVSGAE